MQISSLPTLLLCLFGLLLTTGCNEKEFLEERPLDFFSPENSFNNFEQFQSSIYDLYARVRTTHYSAGDNSYAHFYGTDVMFDARRSTSGGRWGTYPGSLNPTSGIVSYHWERWYKIVSSVNIILDNLDGSELTADEATTIEAEARFFRGLAYRYLTYLYGDIPLYTDAVSSPRTDFVRTPQTEIFAQIIDDLSFAADNLLGIAEAADGQINDLVARHYLAETYISSGQLDQAIAQASLVIDDPATALMTERFGTTAAVEPGDVYYDLFKTNNQNRSSGNTEALWVAQMETDIPGGFLISTGGIDGNRWERNHAPASWTLDDPDGNEGVLTWRSDLNVGGRGVSFMRGTPYVEDLIWESDFDNDIRNAPHNFIRDIIYDNPASAFFGQSAKDNPGAVFLGQDWRWYPWLSKVTTPGEHPPALLIDGTLNLTANAGATYLDQYYLRLAETYLLRAEAYFRDGNMQAAADDINVVRNRANATPVTAGEVSIDYILDERARELSLEEQRRITLHRMGLLVERVRQFNDHNADDIQDFHALWPIPLREIEANTTGNLPQNPGY